MFKGVDFRSHGFLLAVCGLLVLGLTALGGWFRVHDAGESLWLDELHTAWTASGNFADAIPRARIGHQSPVYFWLAWCSVQVFGLNEWTLRLPSLVAGIALIPAAAVVAFRWTKSPAAGVLAAAMVAADYYCVWYAQEARPYALLQLLGLIHVAVFFELCRQPNWPRRLTFVGLGLLLFHLQYTSGLVIAAEIGFYGVMQALRPAEVGYRPRQVASDLALFAVGISPALPWLWSTLAERGNWSHFVPIPAASDLVTLFPIATNFVAPVLIALIMEFAVRRHRSTGQAFHWQPLALLIVWFLAPLLIAWFLTRFDLARLFYRRYLMIVAVAPMLASALVFARLSVMARIAFGVCLVVLSQTDLGRQIVPAGVRPPAGPVQNFVRYGAFTSHASEDWRSAVAIVREKSTGNRLPVFVRSGFMETARLPEDRSPLLREYGLLPVTSIYSLDWPDNLLSPLPPDDRARLTSDQLSQIIQHGGGWLILRGSAGMDQVAADIVSDLAKRGAVAQLSGRCNLRRITVLRVSMGG